jgi:hypothetical protein
MLIIQSRLERFAVLRLQLDGLARSNRAVPTALANPLLDRLQIEAVMLEKVLSIDTAQGGRPYISWQLLMWLSSEHRNLHRELEAIRALLRRLREVKQLGSAGHASGHRLISSS